MKKNTFTKAILQKEINNNLSINEISKKYNCTFYCVKYNIEKFKLKITKKSTGGHNVIDMMNKTIGSMTVIEDAGHNTKGTKLWKCRCACGNTKICLGSELRQGKIKTCGCRINLNKRTYWKGFGDIAKSHWSSIVTQAKYRNIEFDITIKYAWKLFLKQDKKCALTGEILILSPLKDKTASLDRIDNTKGYHKNNIQWIHKDINKLKGKLSEEKLIELCTKVYKYNKK
jgi:hypothetical protein